MVEMGSRIPLSLSLSSPLLSRVYIFNNERAPRDEKLVEEISYESSGARGRSFPSVRAREVKDCIATTERERKRERALFAERISRFVVCARAVPIKDELRVFVLVLPKKGGRKDMREREREKRPEMSPETYGGRAKE